MSENISKPRPEKQKDPLQNFLIFAAILLVALYFLEEWRSSTVEEGALLAENYTKKMGGDCIVHSSGLKGELFVISCPKNSDTEALARRVRTRLALRKFYLKTSYAYLLCEERCETIQAKPGG